MCQLSFTGIIHNIRKSKVKDKTIFDILIDDQSVYFHVVCYDDKLISLLDSAETANSIFAKGECRSKITTINNIVSERFYIKPEIICIDGIHTYQTKTNEEIDDEARKMRERSVVRIREISASLEKMKNVQKTSTSGNPALRETMQRKLEILRNISKDKSSDS